MARALERTSDSVPRWEYIVFRASAGSQALLHRVGGYGWELGAVVNTNEPGYVWWYLKRPKDYMQIEIDTSPRNIADELKQMKALPA